MVMVESKMGYMAELFYFFKGNYGLSLLEADTEVLVWGGGG